MHKLNNKIIPNSAPPTKFRLNHTSLGGKMAMEKDFSLWVGDLSPDVDDYTLYKGFASRYPSVRRFMLAVQFCSFYSIIIRLGYQMSSNP